MTRQKCQRSGYIYPTLFDSKLLENTRLLKNSYVAVPGFIVDAASQITVDVYLRVLKSRASSTLNLYWGSLYLGSVTGYTDPSDSNYLIYSKPGLQYLTTCTWCFSPPTD